MKVLIAEDSLVTRRLLESCMSEWGYEVYSVSDGNEAWKRLQSPEAPNLAILDWMMPGMDGVEVCRRLRRLDTSGQTYIILLTSREKKEDIVAGLDAGADDYVTKPFDSDEFHARIRVGERIVKLQSALANRVLELEDAVAHIRTLQGILPICMHCHRIRDDREVWQRIESYLSKHTDAMLSHSLCPECLEEHYPEIASKKKAASD